MNNNQTLETINWDDFESIDGLNAYYQQRLGDEPQPFIRLLPLKNSRFEYLEVMLSPGGFLFRLFEGCPESRSEFRLVFHPVPVVPGSSDANHGLSIDGEEYQEEWRIFLSLEPTTPAFKSIQWMIDHAKTNHEKQLLQQFIITSERCLKILIKVKAQMEAQN